MNTQTLKLFVDVAHLGSFASAARKHQTDPSKVSRDIASLEKQVNLSLFKRSTRTLSLTQAGQRYLAHIKPIVESLDFAIEDAHSIVNKPSGNLKISASVSFGHTCITPLLKQFMDSYPQINVELLLSDQMINLHNEDIDLAFRLTPSFESDLIGTRLQDTQYFICATPEYLESHLKIDQPEDISKHNCLVFALPKYRSRWLFKKDNQLQQIKISSRLAISNALTLKQSALLGLGPALLPDWMIQEELKSGQLIKVLPEYQITATDFETAVWMLYPSRKYLPQKVQVFIEYVREHFLGRYKE